MTLLRITILIMVLVGWYEHGLANDSDSVNSKLINTNGQQIGEATLTETSNGVLVRLALVPNPPCITPGTHAFHVHQVGKCEPPFKSAGDHFNPSTKKHGLLDKGGGHAGDLPNIYVPDRGSLMVEFVAPKFSLKRGKNSLLDSDGSALVIHAQGDDHKSDPAGESGDRIACGVSEKSSK